jgi:hypothetical protein
MSAPRFEADAMLEKLARYLRCLGLDATCEPALPVRERVAKADREGRVLLTRSRRIGPQAAAPARMLRVASEDPVEQLREVLDAFGIDPAERLFTRCVRCNVDLAEIPKDERVRAAVHPRVFAAYERFYACPRCGTVFWRGSHVSNTCRKLGLSDGAER